MQIVHPDTDPGADAILPAAGECSLVEGHALVHEGLQ